MRRSNRSALSETVDAVLVRIDDARVPRRGNYVNVTKDDLYFAGFSYQNFPTYNDGSTLDARPLTVHDRATDRVIKFGKETGPRKGTLHLSSMAVKEDMYTGSVQLNGRPYGHTLKNQLQIDSYASSTFFQAGDSGSAVFLVDKENKLHCIGLAIGVMSDLTTVFTPIQNILQGLGRQLGKTLEIKKFELEKMDES
ncbi:uncharacterized protein LOC128548685 [Mercenaria mercenaria]|uniref:uncharacterized protein LOC128548685 n=1 Tax=Mercenaria mercenaria TaxID=6596 RepID=UPI00234F29A8|nr:uncharacterized protein LOC128548685 [Mercenaria mercenaria]